MKLVYVLLLSCIAVSGFSQQLPLFTQYREYSGIINPASVPNDYLWYEKTMSFGASYRRQWINDKDGPTTQVLRGDYLSEHGAVSPILGGYLLNDKAGRVGMTGAYVRAAMLFSDEPLQRGFSAGLSAGVVRYGLDLRNANPLDQNSLGLYTYANKNKIFPDVGLGVYAYTTLNNGHLIYGGISVPQVLGLDVRFRDDKKTLSIQRTQHFYGTLGYKIPLQDEASFLEASTWIRFISPLKPSFDLNLRCQLDTYLYFGAGFGSTGIAHMEAGLLVGEDRLVRVGMAADLPFTKVKTYYGTSMEVNVAYAMSR